MNTTTNELKTYTGTPQSATRHTITLTEDASDINGEHTMHIIRIIEGAGRGETQIIKSYYGKSKMATLYGTWITIPDTTSVYVIINPEPAESSVPITLKVDPDLKVEFESLKEIHELTFSDALGIGMKEVIRKVRSPEEIQRRINRKQDEIFGLYSQLDRATKAQKQSEDDTDFRWDRDGTI